MFLNRVKHFLASLSLRTRLTLYYSFTAFILITVIAFFLYWETMQVLYKADYEFLSDEVDTIQYILESNHYRNAALKKEILRVPNENPDSIYRYYIRAYDEHNHVIMETPGLKEILLPAVDKSLYVLEKKRYAWLTMDDTNYLLVQSPIFLKNKAKGSVQILLNISYQHSVVSDSKKLLLTLLIGTICAFLFGFLIANRGIKGLYALVDAAKKTTISTLGQRLETKKLPKELFELGLAFNQMLDRIEHSHSRLKQFSSDLAHELRIPIQNLMGETEIALGNSDSIHNPSLLLRSNLEEFQRIASIIENILFLARAENPSLDIEKEAIHVNKEIQIVCDYYELLAEQKNIALSLRCHGDAVIKANAAMFKRMIGNLLANAIHYTNPLGSIHFSITSLETQVRIILSDSGIGIASAHIPKLFDRFYRVDASRANHSGGTGLGLPIVKSIMEIHQGHIEIDSQPGKGTNVTLTLKKITEL